MLFFLSCEIMLFIEMLHFVWSILDNEGVTLEVPSNPNLFLVFNLLFILIHLTWIRLQQLQEIAVQVL